MKRDTVNTRPSSYQISQAIRSLEKTDPADPPQHHDVIAWLEDELADAEADEAEADAIDREDQREHNRLADDHDSRR